MGRRCWASAGAGGGRSGRGAHLDGALLDLWHARVTAELFEREHKRRHGGRLQWTRERDDEEENVWPTTLSRAVVNVNVLRCTL